MSPQWTRSVSCDDDIVEELKRQLVSWRKVVLVSTSGRSEPRVMYSGKDSGNDDLVIVLGMAAFYGTQFALGHMPLKVADVS